MAIYTRHCMHYEKGLEVKQMNIQSIQGSRKCTQQTTTRDFRCSVSEFTSSTGSIDVFPYVNSLDSVNKFGMSTRVYREITSFSHDDMYQWNHTSSDPVRLVSNSWQRAEHVYSCEYTRKHILVERYQLWTSMTRANWFRNGSLFAGFAKYVHNAQCTL